MDDQRTLLCRYHYDPLDRLSGNAPTSETDTRLFYCQSRLTTLIQGALHGSILQAGDNLLAQQQGTRTGVSSGLLTTDRQRSVMQVIEKGQAQAMRYTAYGYQAPGNGLTHLAGFTGERRDPVTGHYLLGNGYRAFNPVLMRFNSPDNLSPFAKGGINAYAYCQGDPLNHVDPDGHWMRFNIRQTANTLSAVAMGSAVTAGAAAIVINASGGDSKVVMALGVLAAVVGVAGAGGMFASRARPAMQARASVVSDRPPPYRDSWAPPPYRDSWSPSPSPSSESIEMSVLTNPEMVRTSVSNSRRSSTVSRRDSIRGLAETTV